MKIELAKTEIIHFIGIGGIGMSGLALIIKAWALIFRVAIFLLVKILKD